MRCRKLGAVCALLAVLGAATARAEQYPDWKGQWLRKSAGTFDPDRPFGLGQQAPLTPEYQKVLEESVENQANGGQGNNPMAACIPPGMPRMMIGYGGGFEFLITPEVTYAIQGEPMMQFRRIFTDGRSFPKEARPTFSGYSIGRWEGSDGRHDTLVIETRFIRGPRAYDFKRSAVPPEQWNGCARAHLSRQEQSERLARRRDGDRRCPHAPLVGVEDLSPTAENGLARDHLRRGRASGEDRQPAVFPRRRRLPDADPQ